MLQVNNLVGFNATEPLITQQPDPVWRVAYDASSATSTTWSGSISLANKTLITRIPPAFLRAEGTRTRIYLESGSQTHTVNKVTISYAATGTTSDLYDSAPGSIVPVTTGGGSSSWSFVSGSTSGRLIVSDVINFEIIRSKALLIAIATGSTASTASRRTGIAASGGSTVQAWYSAANTNTTETEDRLTGTGFTRTDNASYYIAKIEVA